MIVCTLLALLQAPVDPAELVDRVAQRYLEMKEFLVEYRENRQSPRPMALNTLGTSTIQAAKSGDRYFYAQSSDHTIRIVGDGETVWIHDVFAKRYYEEPAGLAGDQLARDGIKTAVRRFGMMDGNAMHARLLRMDDRRFRGRRVHCAVIEISSAPTDPFAWKERLWIDPETTFVHRSEFEGRSGPADPQHNRVFREFTLPAGAQAPDPALFEFRPPKGVRKVEADPGVRLDGGAGSTSQQGAGRRQ